jgi:hypothetical protein
MKQLSDSEYKVQHLLTLKRKIANSNTIINHRNTISKSQNKHLTPQTIKFSKADILKGNQKLSTLKAQTDVSDKLTKASTDLEAGVIPQLLDQRTTAEKQRDMQLQSKTCMTNCSLLLKDKEQANILFTHLLGNIPLLLFFNFSFPDISSHFSKKKNVLADTVILYIQRLYQVQLRTAGVNDALQYETYVNGVNATNTAIYNSGQNTTNAVVNMGIAGINEARNINTDNINNLNNAGAQLVGEMRNNIIPQLDLLAEIRNGLAGNNQDMTDKLDALIAVIDRDQEIIVNVPPMDQQVIQDAFEQAYINLNLPTKDDIGVIVGEMRGATDFVGEKLDALGQTFETITAENLEAILGVVQSSDKRKTKTPSKGRKMTEPIDDFISKNFTPLTFNNSVEDVNNCATTFGIPTETKGGKQRAMAELIKDINTKVVVPMRLIRANMLTGYQFTEREMMNLSSTYQIPIGDPNTMDKLSQEYNKAEEYITTVLIEQNVYYDSRDTPEGKEEAEPGAPPHPGKEVIRVFDQNVIDPINEEIRNVFENYIQTTFKTAQEKSSAEAGIDKTIGALFDQLVEEYPKQVSDIRIQYDLVDQAKKTTYASKEFTPVKSKAEQKAEAKKAKEDKAAAPKSKSYTKPVQAKADREISNLVEVFQASEFKTNNSKNAAENKLKADVAKIYDDMISTYPQAADKIRAEHEDHKIFLQRNFDEKQLTGKGFNLFMKHKGLGKNKIEHNKTYKLVVREPVNKPHIKLPKKVKRKTRYII